MYVTTFYSFKGGVGRTMALVNVAVELVLQGKRVVAVDFDLEAPGLDTFDLGRPAETTPGILDFVETYLEADRAPEVEDYLFESPPLGEEGGHLWIMPSGSHDERYARRLAALDWQALYEHFDGYLLFEDLKAQWRDALEADYVLIDSRTGHTDVGGICTRQLPDAVVLLFFPNQQNLRGLTKVVRDIRAEPTRSEEDAIDLHYVLSNVPDLDDEDEILRAITSDFQEQLGFRRAPLAIHRYPSLSLLKQDIFTKDRPRSRLAREYKALATEVIRLNPADRGGALEFIRRYERSRYRGLPRGEDRGRRHLKEIEKRHEDDGEVLFRLARLSERRGEEDFARLLDMALDAGFRTPEAYLERAHYRRFSAGDRAGASQDALAALRAIPSREGDAERPGLGWPETYFPEISRALRLLHADEIELNRDDLKQLLSLPALQELSANERVVVAGQMLRNQSRARLAAALLEPLLGSEDLEDEQLDHVRSSAALAFLATGRHEEAAAVCRDSAPSIDSMSVQQAFNYGMALWAQRRDPPQGPFARVVELDSTDPPDRANANYAQCLALAHWVAGTIDAAKEALSLAESRIQAERSSFSCWRYLEAPARTFRQDLREMRQLFDGDRTMTPRFMRPASQGARAGSSSDQQHQPRIGSPA